MLKLALTVVAIALPDCLNPSLIGGELFVATGPRARRAVVAYTLAALGVTLIFGVALALGLGDLILSVVPKPGATVKYALITVAGGLMIIGGVVIWLRRKALTRPKPGHEERRHHGSPAVIGAGLAGVELLSAFPYFAAIALIVGSGVSNAGKLWLLILYCVVYGLPLIAIAVTFAVMGDRAEQILRPAGDWLSSHWPAVVAPTTAVIGIAVLTLGVVQLNST